MSLGALSLHERLRAKHGDRLVVEDLSITDDAILAVGGVRVESDVADHADVVVRVLDAAHRAAHEIVGVRCFLAVWRFELRRAGMPSDFASPTAFTRRSILNRSTPGIEGTGVRTPCPSWTNTGQIKSAGVTLDSRVRRRTQSWRRLRRMRVLGNSG